MSTVETNLVQPSTGTTLTLGASGDTVAVGSGASTSGFASGLNSVQVFTSSGTWTRPASITKVIMEVQGGGGGGGKGPNGDYDMNGAGGGYAKKFLDVSSISTSTITAGAAGTNVSAGTTGSGGTGGNSVWSDGSNTITAKTKGNKRKYMMAGALVLPETMVGMMEASATRRPSMPWTCNCSSTTARSSDPILHVPMG